MALVTENLYDPKKKLYVARAARFGGRDYKKGDLAPVKDMTHRTLMKYFRTGLFVHDVRVLRQDPLKIKTEKTQKDTDSKPTQKRRRSTLKSE